MDMRRPLLLTASVAVLCLTSGLSTRGQAARTDPIGAWSVAASNAAAASGMAPFRTPISLAILHVAMYDAVTTTDPNSPHAGRPRSSEAASAHAAAVEAGYRVLLAEFPSQAPALLATYQTLMAGEPDSMARQRGADAGAAAAQRLLARRANDGRNAVVPYTPGSELGGWVPTPPGLLRVDTAFLSRVTPFTMDDASQFRPAGPPAMRSTQWAADYNEVKRLGAKNATARTPDQTATALFWEPLAGTVWFATIRRLAREQMFDLPSSARFQAAAFAAFADALIACWDAKFHFNFWRPITAIRGGETDGNPSTDADPTWEPLAVTPNFPEYPSGHACATAAVAHTIEDFFDDDTRIPARNVVTGEERVYRRASEVVREVNEARMLLGVHFRSADEDGAEIGRKVAQQIRRVGFRPSAR